MVSKVLERKKMFALTKASLAVGALIALNAHGFEIDSGNPDMAIRWDNTIKYSTANRLKDPSASLAGSALGNANQNDGDSNFKKGQISSRWDLLTEFDAVYKNQMGVRVSAASWYDSAYMKNPTGVNDANNAVAPGAAPMFPGDTKNIHGKNSEILDAFIFSKLDLDGGQTGTVRAGKHSVLWGESLFFGGNAIAGGMMPVDVVKLLSVPGTQFKEAIRPVPMVSGQLQLNSDVSLGAYVQTQWQANRLPGVGSYFSNDDHLVSGGQNILLPASNPAAGGFPIATRSADSTPKNSGQGGLQLKIRGDDVDYGLYAIRFHNKMPQSVVDSVFNGGAPFGMLPGSYSAVYHEGIRAFGASASKTFGEFNVAIEGSMRQNQDLASTTANSLGGMNYPVGKTAHINLSTLASLGKNPLWNEATFLGEIAWNRVLSITSGAEYASATGTRDGVAARFVLEPIYRGVFSGVDMGVPIGLGYAPKGSRPLAVGNPNAWIPEGGGDLTLGLNFSYLDAWRLGLAYTHYYGPEAGLTAGIPAQFTWGQSMKDRDFISASLRYSF
jgi:Protein of unknown function (DUF1302)